MPFGGNKASRKDTANVTVLFFVHLWQVEKCPSGTKPCLLFSGEPFENEAEYKRLKSVLIGEDKSVHTSINLKFPCKKSVRITVK